MKKIKKNRALKLEPKDKTLLLRWGHQAADFPQIEAALLAKSTKYTLDGHTISQAAAIALLGREQFLSGISRSAFHATAARKQKLGKLFSLILPACSNNEIILWICKKYMQYGILPMKNEEDYHHDIIRIKYAV